MVDFAALLAKRVAEMTPDERQSHEAGMAALAEREALERPISSVWSYQSSPGGQAMVTMREIRLRIEPARVSAEPEVLRFIGGPTGHEAYRVDADFLEILFKGLPGDKGEWAICAGTAGRWAQCTVKTADIVAYLDEMRPETMAPARAKFLAPAMVPGMSI